MFALGLNHSTAPVDLRGRFAFTLDQLAPALHGFRERMHGPGAPEAALLSTCNRTELYCAADPAQSRELVRPAIDWLAGVGGVGGQHLLDHAYVMEDAQVARHAFRVASGLDSMVLGEPQILGQMKDAVREAGDAGALGTHAAPAVPALLLGRQGSAQRDRDRRAFHQHGGRRGAPGGAAVRGPAARSRCCSSAPAR